MAVRRSSFSLARALQDLWERGRQSVLVSDCASPTSRESYALGGALQLILQLLNTSLLVNQGRVNDVEFLLESGGVNLGDRELLLDDGDVLGGLLALLLVGSARVKGRHQQARFKRGDFPIDSLGHGVQLDLKRLEASDLLDLLLLRQVETLLQS